jgi:hypothetical protein
MKFIIKSQIAIEAERLNDFKTGFGVDELNSKVIKTMALVGLIFWIAALLITRNSPSTGYESSIYSSTPLIFWIANICNFIIGIGIILSQICFREDNNAHDLWVIGLAMVILAFTSIFLLWIIRGYSLLGDGYDLLSHLGTTSNLISSGHLEPSNFYPISSIFLAQLSEMSGISPIVYVNIVPFIFSLFSILFVYCLARTVLPAKKQALLAILIWMAFLSSYWLQLTPNVLANLYFPIILLVLIKCFYTQQIQWKVLLIILIFLLPLFHPIVGFVLTGFALITWLFQRFIRRNTWRTRISWNNSVFVMISMVISLIWCVYWTSGFSIWQDNVDKVIAIFTNETPSNINSLVGELTYASNYYSVVTMFFKMYTGQIVIIGLTCVSLIFLWKKGIFKLKLSALFLLFSPMPFIAIAIVFLYFSAAGFGPLRLLIFFILLGTLFVSYFLYELIRRSKFTDSRIKTKIKFSNINMFSICFLLLFLFIIGFLQLYPSRYVLQPNWQITHSEFTGMKWFTYNKVIETDTASFTVNSRRWASVFLTEKEYLAEGYRYYGSPDNVKIPWHFGYDKNPNLGHFYDQDVYMILCSRDRQVYQDTWPELSAIRLQIADFNRVEEDPSICKLYSNESLDVYRVESLPETDN